MDEARHAGQLDLDEHQRRTTRAGRATTDAELDSFAADLAAGAAVERRLTDDDRQRVVDQLRRAVGDGRLDLPRYEERVRAAAQVEPLLADLVAPPRPASRGLLDALFDRFVINSALLPRPRGPRQRWTSKRGWKISVIAALLGYLAGLVAVLPLGQDAVPFALVGVCVLALAFIIFGSICTETWEQLVRDRTEDVIADLTVRLSEQPGVREAEVENRDRGLTVRLGVATGTEVEPLVEEAVRLAWLSRLWPLSHVHVEVSRQTGEPEDVVRYFDRHESPALRHRYGPRPYGPYPEPE